MFCCCCAVTSTSPNCHPLNALLPRAARPAQSTSQTHIPTPPNPAPQPPCSFVVSDTWLHDASLAVYTESSVLANGRGVDLSIDTQGGCCEGFDTVGSIAAGVDGMCWPTGGAWT